MNIYCPLIEKVIQIMGYAFIKFNSIVYVSYWESQLTLIFPTINCCWQESTISKYYLKKSLTFGPFFLMGYSR